MDALNSLANLAMREISEHPYHIIIEVLFVALIAYLLPQKAYKPKKKPDELTESEIQEIVDDWKPEPLAPEETEEEIDNVPLIEGASAAIVVANGKKVLNLASYNFLGLIGNEHIQEKCKLAIKKYGVGACGPRGFYGTIDVHLELESQFAKFMGTEKSILYSYGFATITSALPAFSKRGDIIVCDEGVNFAVQTGVDLARSRVYYFKHNDVEDLERVLKSIVAKDKKGKPIVERRFVVIEGLYQNHGDVSPLVDIVALKNKYRFRLVMDDSFGFGVLGRTGKGTIEHFNVPISEVEIMTVSLENAFASVGGICFGSNQVVDHQRLSGAGYCFSAALPPYNAIASVEGLKILIDENQRLDRLRQNAKLLFDEVSRNLHTSFRMSYIENSPIAHLRLVNPDLIRQNNEKILQKIVNKAFEQGIGLTRAKYAVHEKHLPASSIRITVSADHEAKALIDAAKTIKQIVAEVADELGN